MERSAKPRFSLAALFALVTASAVLLWLYFSVYPFGPLLAWFGLSALVAKVALQIQNRWLGYACAVMFAVGVLAIPSLLVDGHSVSPYQLKRIHVGSTAAEVESILGLPSSVTTDPAGDDWQYAGPTWCHVNISFDSSGVVDDVEHDH